MFRGRGGILFRHTKQLQTTEYSLAAAVGTVLVSFGPLAPQFNSIQLIQFQFPHVGIPTRLSLIDSTRLDSFGATLPVYTIV